MRLLKGIIYVNFAPYDNAGNILDFLIDNFLFVAHFSLKFHNIKKKGGNVLTIYKNGKESNSFPLFNLKVPEPLLFLFLPLTSLFIILQLSWYIFILRVREGKVFDYFFSVNALIAWLGNTLKSLSVVNETIFWVWDYYPIKGTQWDIKLMRSLYWYFDNEGTKKSSHTFFLDSRLLDLRRKYNLISKDRSYPIIPIGTKITSSPKKTDKKIPIIGYLGVIKKSQGLDILCKVLPHLLKLYPNLKIEIIGSGPDENRIRKKMKTFNKTVRFYGYLESYNKVESIMERWSAGIATYLPSSNNPASYTDSSKIKVYLSKGIPVICTNIIPFAQEIKRNKAGFVISYDDEYRFILSIDKLIKKTTKYSNNAWKLAKKYNYEDIYKSFFRH